ncbi:epithelial membrane protein 1 [Vombatus ursinus]|uniref:epithelial membrane protein 1 n=1 Tax=Vombatus ursinus TaxID=29139 RepID=UPI000FFD2453|nr:epithelial membrane protein 1 [Vombatus ursinus]
MLVLLAGIFVVHIATVVMLFVSTIANVWIVSNNGTSWGLWNPCSEEKCSELSYAGKDIWTDALKSVQAFMILAIIFSVISLIVFVFQLFTMEKGNRFFLSGGVMLVCWLCILIGVSIYTDKYGKGTSNLDHHGYSFILAWICFCFSFIIGVLYLVLRKK